MKVLVLQSLEVFLRGSRTYVQGTQMIAQAAKVAGAGARLSGAKFLRITDRCLALAKREEAVNPLAELSFVLPDGNSFVLCACETSGLAPRRELALDCSLRRRDEDGDVVRYGFFASPGFESRLNALVQAVKTEQDRRHGAICSNWFTGLRRTALSLEDLPAPTERGEIALTFDRLNKLGDFSNVLYRFEMRTTPEAPSEEGLISFTFQQDKRSDASRTL